MEPREPSRRAAYDYQAGDSAVLEQTSSVTGVIAEGTTAMPMSARRPAVISSVPGTEHVAGLLVSLRSRVVLTPTREVGAPHRGRRGR